jgi:hypothetical protein
VSCYHQTHTHLVCNIILNRGIRFELVDFLRKLLMAGVPLVHLGLRVPPFGHCKVNPFCRWGRLPGPGQVWFSVPSASHPLA